MTDSISGRPSPDAAPVLNRNAAPSPRPADATPLPPVSAATRLLVLLGDPVGHSLSPAFQNAAIRHAGIDAIYTALRCDAQSVAPLIRALCRGGGGGNVTVPHKAIAAQCIERPSDAVLRTAACNTFWGADGAICGDNTDVEGFRGAATALCADQGRELRGARVLIVGAGGAAAAALCALIDDGAAAVTLLNRSPDRARALADRFDPAGSTVTVVTTVATLHDAAFDLVVNATSLGLDSSDPLPFDLSVLGDVGAALDLVYRSDRRTPWACHARALDIPTGDGTAMLIGQGAAAFRQWFGRPAPLDVMRDALRQ